MAAPPARNGCPTRGYRQPHGPAQRGGPYGPRVETVAAPRTPQPGANDRGAAILASHDSRRRAPRDPEACASTSAVPSGVSRGRSGKGGRRGLRQGRRARGSLGLVLSGAARWRPRKRPRRRAEAGCGLRAGRRGGAKPGLGAGPAACARPGNELRGRPPRAPLAAAAWDPAADPRRHGGGPPGRAEDPLCGREERRCQGHRRPAGRRPRAAGEEARGGRDGDVRRCSRRRPPDRRAERALASRPFAWKPRARLARRRARGSSGPRAARAGLEPHVLRLGLLGNSGRPPATCSRAQDPSAPPPSASGGRRRRRHEFGETAAGAQRRGPVRKIWEGGGTESCSGQSLSSTGAS